MKKLLLLGVSLCITSVYAQEYKTKLANTKDRKVTIEMGADNIRIEGHNSDDVIIQASSTYEVPPEAKGLKPLYNTAVENTGIGLAVTSESGGLRIEKAVRRPINYTIKLPRKVAVLFEKTNGQKSDLTLSNMDGDLELRSNFSFIDLRNVTGPVVANTINGSVTIVYTALSQAKPTAISTINGSIDVTLPTNTKATIKLRTINGELFTDFDLGLKNTKDGLSKVGGGNNVEGTINSGGVEMQLHTINSNVYVRKQK